MFVSSARRRRRRWPFVLAALLVLLGAGAAGAYFGFVQAPGDVTNTDVEFVAPAPEAEEEERRSDDRVAWPTYGFDPQRTRHLEADLGRPGRRVWHFGGSKLIEFPPVYARGKLFFIKNNGEAYALSARDGGVLWRKRVGQLAASSPAFDDGRVFITTLTPGKVLALDGETGRTIWEKELPSRTESSPLVMRDRVYFGSEDGTVYALQASNGKTVWTYKAAGSVKAALAYSDGKLYFGDYAGQVTALRRRDGSRVWSTGTEGRSFGRAGNFYSTPAVAFGRVYVGNTDSRVYSFSARSGELAWSKSTGAFVYAAPAVADTRGTDPSVYIGSYDGAFYALDARTGETRWSYDAGGRISGAPTVIGEIVYFSNLGAKSTTGLDIESGEPVWKFGRGAFTPMVSDGRRFYVTGYSSLYAFEPVRRSRRR